MRHFQTTTPLAHQPTHRHSGLCLILAALAVCLAPITSEANASSVRLHESAPVGPSAPQLDGWSDDFHLPGVDDVVYALASGPDGSIYVGGQFATAGGLPVNYIARWDGAAWHSLGTGMSSSVLALAVGSDGSLYAAGSFLIAGGAEANRVARWDAASSSWQALGSGVDGVVYALAVGPDGSLYAGGEFTTAGGIAASNIARWDASTPSWHALSNGVNGDVRALAFVPDGSLYVGGEFTAADYRPSTHIARWGELPPTAVTLVALQALTDRGPASSVWLVLAMVCLALTAGAAFAHGRVRT